MNAGWIGTISPRQDCLLEADWAEEKIQGTKSY